MFDWLRKKPLTAGEVKAYQSGQDVGAQMAKALIEFRHNRFGRVHDKFLNVLRERLQNAARSEEAPPLLVAKIEGDLLVENLDKLKVDMFDETMAVMSDWLRLAQQVDLRPEIEKLITDSVFEFCENLGADAVKVATEYQVVLHDADAAWRTKYPDKLAEFTRKG